MSMHIKDLTDSQLIDACERAHADFMYYEAAESMREYSSTRVQRDAARRKRDALFTEAVKRGLLD